MCGRYTLDVHLNALLAALKQVPEEIQCIGEITLPRYNIAPTDVRPRHPPVIRTAPVLYLRDQQARLEALIWRLIPRWSHGQLTNYSTINAKQETITSSKMYQGPWLDGQRCLVPTTGVIEWQATGNGPKQPYLISLNAEQSKQTQSSVFCMAGIWEASSHSNGRTEYSFSILTTTPNDSFLPIHDRMPVILAPEQYTDWLHTTPEHALAMCQPYPKPMQVTAIGRAVNNPNASGPELLQPLQQNTKDSTAGRTAQPETGKEEIQQGGNMSLFD